MRSNAGIVKITPAARDSPAEAAVCTILFSRILEFRNTLNIPMEITAAGIDADTVIPANSPRYAFAPAKTIERIMPRRQAFMVISAG